MVGVTPITAVRDARTSGAAQHKRRKIKMKRGGDTRRDGFSHRDTRHNPSCLWSQQSRKRWTQIRVGCSRLFNKGAAMFEAEVEMEKRSSFMPLLLMICLVVAI